MEIKNNRVSWMVVDAWKPKPPCNPESEDPYCHVQCPHFDECYPEDNEEEEEWSDEG